MYSLAASATIANRSTPFACIAQIDVRELLAVRSIRGQRHIRAALFNLREGELPGA